MEIFKDQQLHSITGRIHINLKKKKTKQVLSYPNKNLHDVQVITDEEGSCENI